MPLTKLVYCAKEGQCYFQNTMYDWFSGGNTETEQMQARVKSLHERFNLYLPGFNILEISSISEEPLGVEVSGLKLRDSRGNLIEGVYRGSRVYEGGQLKDLYHVDTASQAIHDKLGNDLGMFSEYDWYGQRVPTEPVTLMKHWIWCEAVYNQKDLREGILKYDAFTNYFSNTARDYFGCYPHAASILVALNQSNVLDIAMKDITSFAYYAYGISI